MDAKKNHFQQSDFWCGFKSCHGWNVVKVDECNVLVRNFKKAFLDFSIAYADVASFTQYVSAEQFVKALIRVVKMKVLSSHATCASSQDDRFCFRYDM